MDPRPAATVVVARPADPGIEVLVLRRAQASRFAPGFVVFPGGLVEDDDRARAARWWGDPGEAPRAAAIRELHEETGLLLTASGPRAGFSLDDAPPPEPASLPEMARWIAPEFLEVRFDASFFAAAAPRGLDPRPDELEIAEAAWEDPRTVLDASTRGDAPLMWPTLVTLERLARCGSVDEVLALRIEQIAPGEADRPGARGSWRRPEGKARR